MNLTTAPSNVPLKVLRVAMPSQDDVISRRLMELGFIEGAIVKIRHKAPFLSDPIAVVVRGMMVALRKYEASRIEVSLERMIDSQSSRQ